jgi:hypothetical protein
MKEDQKSVAPTLLPALRNPSKMETLQSGQGAAGRKKCTRSFASKLRRYLESGTKQATDSEGRNRLRQILDNLVEIASDPQHPHSVSAAQVLLDRGYGKPAPSQEELGAIRTGGFQIVYMERPLINGPVEDYAPPLPPQPDFLDRQDR